MAEKTKEHKKPAPAKKAAAVSEHVAESWSEAVEAEAKAWANSQGGSQLARLDAFRAMKVLDEAGAACDAGTHAPEAAESSAK